MLPLLWACWAAANRALMELVGSLGSRLVVGIPTALAAASSCAAAAEAEVVEDGLELLRGGPCGGVCCGGERR